MSMQTKTPEQHLAMCGQLVYGLVEDRIDELQITGVKIDQVINQPPAVSYLLKSTSEPFTDFHISPLNVFESVDDLLTQMAADYTTRRKIKKPKK